MRPPPLRTSIGANTRSTFAVPLRLQPRASCCCQALACAAHQRLAEPLSPTDEGLGMPEPQSSILLALGLHPPHAAKALPVFTRISGGL